MDKSTKIIAILLAAIVAVFILVVAVTTTLMNKDDDVTVTATHSSTIASSVQGELQSTAASQTTVAAATTAAPEIGELIIGKWTDSANMSGYEFFSDGTVEMTYVNLTIPFINIPINGVSKGTYSLNGDKLTTKFSIYSATIENTYTVSVENNTLSMKNQEDGETATYNKTASGSSGGASDSQQSSSADDIIGSWINDDSSVRYLFSSDSTLTVKYSNANVPSVSENILNGEYTGIYLTEGSSIIIQFTVDGKKITGKYDFSVIKNTLSFTDESGNTELYVREGTAIVGQGSGELIGKWRDSAGMSGYEFKEGGVVMITYVDFTIPVINMPINGTFTGSYTVEGNSITISSSIYGNSSVETYNYSLSANSLTLTSADGNVSTYVKQ